MGQITSISTVLTKASDTVMCNLKMGRERQSSHATTKKEKEYLVKSTTESGKIIDGVLANLSESDF